MPSTSKSKNINRVIIIGAGFSIAAGIPPQNRLLNEISQVNMEDLNFQQLSIQHDWLKLNQYLISLYGNNWDPMKVSLEDVYTMMDTAILKQRNIGIFNPSSLFMIREAFDRLILYIIDKEISREDIQEYGKKIFNVMGEGKTEFISLNWDYLLERVFISHRYSINYGVPLERTYKQAQENSKVLILKPHGSLNWRLCPICESIYAFMEYENISHCKKCKPLFKTQTNIIDTLGKLDVSFNEKLLPLLVSPTFIKSNSIPQLNTITNKMQEILAKADELVFIGYSLPISDHDIRELLIKSFSIKPKQSVHVILKPSTQSEKNELIKHYDSIFPDSILTFEWDGF
jgi:NAD-dependent SIR2 family protein deacetylase